MALFICFIGEEDDLEAAEIRSLQLGFEIPRNFLNPDKYRPASIPDEAFAAVPDVITTAIFNVMDAQVPIDAFTPFLYLRNGRLEEFVVAYFMKLVSARVKSNMSRFFTAMHLIKGTGSTSSFRHLTSWLLMIRLPLVRMMVTTRRLTRPWLQSLRMTRPSPWRKARSLDRWLKMRTSLRVRRPSIEDQILFILCI